MIVVRSDAERSHCKRRTHAVWRTFFDAGAGDPLSGGFGRLDLLDEISLRPGASLLPQRRRNGEVITYVQQGALTYQDPFGLPGAIEAGEVQCKAAREPTRLAGAHRPRVEPTRVFQIWLRSSPIPLEPRLEQRLFSAAERRGGLVPVVTPDARSSSLRGQQDVILYSALLDAGQHVIHGLEAGRRAWLHVVQGELTLANHRLSAGDGAGVTAERNISFKALTTCEVLLVDLGPMEIDEQ